MSAHLYITSSPGEIRLAVTENNTLVDFALWRPAAPDGVGNIYSGCVTAIFPSMGGAFVHIRQHIVGFLPLPKGSPPLSEGQRITTQITRAAQKGKGVRLALINTTPEAPIGTCLSYGPTPLERLANQWTHAPISVDSPAVAARIPHHLRHRRIPGFLTPPEDIIAACENLEEEEISLPKGMRAIITQTPALTAIDIDAPPLLGNISKHTTQYNMNVNAFPALIRHIRLRNLSGAIVIDPAGVTSRKRQDLLTPIRSALKADPLRPRCLGITSLGLIEIVRTRIYPPLTELYTSAHGHALRALRHIVCHMPQSTRLRCGVHIIKALEHDTNALAECATSIGHPITLCHDPSLPAMHWIPEI